MTTAAVAADWKSMAGTEGTGQYLVIGRTSSGRIGIRPLRGGQVRVRIEPVSSQAASTLSEHFPREKCWKQPGDSGEDRFSRVIVGEAGIVVVEQAIKALGSDFERNAPARLWRRHLRA